MKITEKKFWHMKFGMVRDDTTPNYEWWVWKSNNSDDINSQDVFKGKGKGNAMGHEGP
jgi:hypothetical protein